MFTELIYTHLQNTEKSCFFDFCPKNIIICNLLI